MTVLTYDEAHKRLFNTIRIGVSEEDKRLRPLRMRELLDRLGAPDRQYAVLHIAGTKGKGSTAAMCAAVIAANGMQAGLYTSPHLQDVRERIQLNFQRIPPDDFARIYARVEPHFHAVGGLGFPEMLMAVGLCYFAECGADAVVLETHVGGLRDATSAVTPAVSIITPIGYDHQEVLGDTLADIARHKAGIIKSGVPVVTAPQSPEALAVIAGVAREKGTTLLQVERDLTADVIQRNRSGQTVQLTGTDRYDVYRTNLLGDHQAVNMATAVAALRISGLALPEDAYRTGLQRVRWAGRLEVVQRSPLVVLDCAHTVESAAALADAVAQYFAEQPRVMVYASKHKKDVAGILRPLLPLLDALVITTLPDLPMLSPDDIASRVSRDFSKVYPAPDVDTAMNKASKIAGDDGLVLVSGSVYLVGAVRSYLGL